MKATNQGFVDLHTPFGFMVIGLSFIAFAVLIAFGSTYFRQIAAQEKLGRQKLKKELLERKQADADK